VVAILFLSQTPNDRLDEPIDNSFTYENLIVVSVITPWFAKIANYLVSGRLPQHFSHREHCALFQKIGPFTCIKGYLFKLGPDQILRRCVRENEVYEILKEYHDERCKVHFFGTRNAKNILSTGCY
jgi:hypothetical protein